MNAHNTEMGRRRPVPFGRTVPRVGCLAMLGILLVAGACRRERFSEDLKSLYNEGISNPVPIAEELFRRRNELRELDATTFYGDTRCISFDALMATRLRRSGHAEQAARWLAEGIRQDSIDTQEANLSLQLAAELEDPALLLPLGALEALCDVSRLGVRYLGGKASIPCSPYVPVYALIACGKYVEARALLESVWPDGPEFRHQCQKPDWLTGLDRAEGMMLRSMIAMKVFTDEAVPRSRLREAVLVTDLPIADDYLSAKQVSGVSELLALAQDMPPAAGHEGVLMAVACYGTQACMNYAIVLRSVSDSKQATVWQSRAQEIAESMGSVADAMAGASRWVAEVLVPYTYEECPKPLMFYGQVPLVPVTETAGGQTSVRVGAAY